MVHTLLVHLIVNNIHNSTGKCKNFLIINVIIFQNIVEFSKKFTFEVDGWEKL